MNRKEGLYYAGISFCFWLCIMLTITWYLPVWLDTMIMLSWTILPGVVGGLVFYVKDNSGQWDE